MKSFSQFAFFLSLATGAKIASGFSPDIIPVAPTRPSSDIFSANPSMESSSDLVQSMNMDLPKNAMPFREDKQKFDALEGVEVGIGRVAMVAALVFFGVEVTTDTSIPEQLSTLGLLS